MRETNTTQEKQNKTGRGMQEGGELWVNSMNLKKKKKSQSLYEQQSGRSAMWLWLGPLGSFMYAESTVQDSCQSSTMEKLSGSGILWLFISTVRHEED